MTRTQLSFEREMLHRAKARADELGVSLAEYVRRLVARDLGERPGFVGPEAVFGLGHSGGSDVAAEEDRMMAEAFGAQRS